MYKRPRLTASPYFAEVSPKKRNPEGSTQLPVTWGLTYLCKEQHFQAFTLKSTDDRQGLVDVVGERVLNLTQEQRLTPVMIKFLPREPPQKVYLFCLVRSNVPADKVLFLLKSLNRQICFDGRTKEEHVIQLIKMYPNCLHADRDYFTGRQQTVRFPAPELDVSVAAVVVRNTGDLLLPERQPDTFHHGNYTPEKECYELSPPVTPELARKVQDLERQQALFVTRKDFDKLAADYKAAVEMLQIQVNTMGVARQEQGGSPPSTGTFVSEVTGPEEALLALFPINHMTTAVMDLLKHDIVAMFIRLQVIQKCYGSDPVEKPEQEKVVNHFLDFVLSKRFQAHSGQPEATKGPKLDYSRVSLPNVVFNIYTNYIQSLGQPRLEGTKPVVEIFRDKMSNAKKQYINRGPIIKLYDTLEDKAMAFLTERKDFMKHNKNLFTREQLDREWTFEDEVVKSKSFCAGTRNIHYDPNSFRVPKDVDGTYFPGMRCGTTLSCGKTARAILQGLNDLPELTIPPLRTHVWELLNSAPKATEAKIEEANKRMKRRKIQLESKAKRIRDLRHMMNQKEGSTKDETEGDSEGGPEGSDSSELAIMEPEIEVSTEANIRLVTSIDKFGKQITRKVNAEKVIESESQQSTQIEATSQTQASVEKEPTEMSLQTEATSHSSELEMSTVASSSGSPTKEQNMQKQEGRAKQRPGKSRDPKQANIRRKHKDSE